MAHANQSYLDNEILIREAKNGCKTSENKLVEVNMRYVHKRVNYFAASGGDSSALLSAGLFGLKKAIDSFDIASGSKFITYASRCIENEILMYLRNERKHANVISLETKVFSNDRGDSRETTILDVISNQSDENTEFIDYKPYITHLLKGAKKLEAKKGLKTSDLTFVVVEEYFMKGLNQEQIALKLNKSRSYVSRLLQRGLASIRAFASKEGVTSLADVTDLKVKDHSKVVKKQNSERSEVVKVAKREANYAILQCLFSETYLKSSTMSKLVDITPATILKHQKNYESGEWGTDTISATTRNKTIKILVKYLSTASESERARVLDSLKVAFKEDVLSAENKTRQPKVEPATSKILDTPPIIQKEGVAASVPDKHTVALKSNQSVEGSTVEQQTQAFPVFDKAIPSSCSFSLQSGSPEDIDYFLTLVKRYMSAGGKFDFSVSIGVSVNDN